MKSTTNAKKKVEAIPKSKTWIDEVLDATKEAETPRSFIFWASLFCIGASTKRNIFLPRSNLWNLYPNLYILLIAESGLGKQFPIDLAKTLLRTSGKVRMYSGQNSIQGILGQMGKATTLENGTIIRNAESAFISGEFVNFLLDDPTAFTTTMEWYDTHAHDIWDKTLKNEKFTLRNVFVNFLAATNLELFNDRVPVKDIKGGFLGRILPIKESAPARLNSLTDREAKPIDFGKLSTRLNEISKLTGSFDWGIGAIERYDDWYYPFYSDKNRPQDKAHFSNRIRDHILKVAMCLSLSYKDELLLTVEDIEAAIKLCLPLLDTVMEITQDMGQSRYKGLNAMVVQQLIKAKNHAITKAKLINDNKGEFNFKEFIEVVQTLIESEVVEPCEVNGKPGYKLTEEAIRQLSKL